MAGIDIGVGGRFHADRLAGALTAQGHSVRVWSSYPRSRFSAAVAPHVQSILWPELAYRLARKLGLEDQGDVFKMKSFGQALARRLSRKDQDIFIGWSSFSLETLQKGRHRHRALLRDSSHIRTQMRILEEEAQKRGVAFTPRPTAIAREEAEYAAADTIFVLSQFARQSFVENGVAAQKLRVLPLGADTRLFRPGDAPPSEGPLRVLYFGSVSWRKGVAYLLDAARRFSPQLLELTVLGPVDSALRPLLCNYPHVRFLPAHPQARIAEMLPTFHVFALPTLEDGFGQTLVQAMAAGVVPITTDRCGAAERLTPGENGLRIKAASVDALEEALGTLAHDRAYLGRLRENLLRLPPVDWRGYEQALWDWTKTLGD